MTALWYAARNAHKEIVGILINHGADVNAQDKKGKSVICHAAEYQHKEIVVILLANGADISTKDIESRATIKIINQAKRTLRKKSKKKSRKSKDPK